MNMPPYWIEFIVANGLVGRSASISEADDQSGIGAEMEFLDAEGSRSEAEDLYPGIAVSPDGFIPVGSCLIGSGDPFFIQVSDGEGGPLYRIYHDAVSANGYDRSQAVVVVLNNYRDLLRYLGA